MLKRIKRRLSNKKPVIKPQRPTPRKRKYVSTDSETVEPKEDDVVDLAKNDGDDIGADKSLGIGVPVLFVGTLHVLFYS